MFCDRITEKVYGMEARKFLVSENFELGFFCKLFVPSKFLVLAKFYLVVGNSKII